MDKICTETELLSAYSPTFKKGHNGEQQCQVDEIVDTISECSLQTGLTSISVTAIVPTGLSITATSQPGLSIEVHLKGCSKTQGLGHRTCVELFETEANAIATQQPESWKTTSKAGEAIALYSLFATPEWLERYGFDFGRQCNKPLSHLHTWRRPLAADTIAALWSQMFSADQPQIQRLEQESIALKVMASMLCDSDPQTMPRVDSRTRRRANAARAYFAESSMEDLSLEQAAQALGTSPRQLQRDFQVVFNTTPFAFAREYRLQRAVELLQAGELSITQAAFNAGYASASAFSRSMKRTFGLSPRDLQRR